jgi:hypothetical protein
MQEAAMRLRAHRRALVVCRPSDGHSVPRLTRPPRAERIRRFIHTSGLLTAIGLLRLAGAVRPHWRPLLGVALTVVGVMLRKSPWGAVLLPGLLLILSAPIIPPSPAGDGGRRRQLERELAAYSTPAQRCDLEATLDRYPDSVTRELHAILARQAMSASYTGGPPAGQH